MMKHQKCLVHSNLKELHVAWNDSHPDKKAKFAALRCVLARDFGTHSVCKYPKLMTAACLKSDVHELMKYCVIIMRDV